MQIKINGKFEEINGETTVLDLLKARGVEPRMVAVEVNAEMVEKDDFETTRLKDGDAVEFLYYMGGGA
ncbi:MAG: sulfur carrier protein ThiS [Nitrospirae bacterium]|nr:sulfur carrier protein ThiS [Nitrospirota bacterium]